MYKKYISLIVIFLMAISRSVFAYDFSVVATTGQTLYFDTVFGYAMVTSQNTSAPYYSTYPSGDLTIPTSVAYNGNTYSVRYIDNNAFRLCANLTSVSFPDSLYYIGQSAFYSCSNLSSVIIPNSVWHIGDSSFSRTGLTSVIIPGSALISNYAFFDCNSLSSVTIQNNVKYIGRYAFAYCYNLTSITLPDSLIRINDNAFYWCNGLTSVIFPDSLIYIGNHAFDHCTSLTSITIPLSVVSIGDRAFDNCSNITSVYFNARNCNSMGNNSTSSFSQVIFGNNNLSLVSIGDSVNNIPKLAFVHNLIDSVILNPATPPTFINHAAIDYYPLIPEFPFSGVGHYIVSCANYESYAATGLYSPLFITPLGMEVNVDVNDTIKGSALIIPQNGNNVGCDSTVIILATANNHYHFSHWSNGSTANPDTIALIGDSSVTAFFAPNRYSLSVMSGNPDLGTANGSGEYDYLDTVVISTSAIEHYHFVRWDDGNTENPRQVVIECDTAFTAFFAIDTHTVSVSTNDIVRGMVHSSGIEFVYGAPCTVTATAYTGYTFAGWSNGVSANPYTFAVISDVELIALFVAEGEEVYTVTAVSANPIMGTVSGGGQALDGGTVTIRAAANPGYHFLRWNDNNTDSVRTIEVHGNVTYTAYFEANDVGIIDVDAINAKVYTSLGHIVVEGTEGNTVWLYDVNGRILATKQDEYSPLRFDVPASGTYLIKIGNHPARRVVVIR